MRTLVGTLLFFKAVESSSRHVDSEHPMITASPSLSEATRTWELKPRDLLSDAVDDVSSVLGGLGSNIPSYGRCQLLMTVTLRLTSSNS